MERRKIFVVPVGDSGMHNVTESCICNPVTLNTENNFYKFDIIVHNRFDGKKFDGELEYLMKQIEECTLSPEGLVKKFNDYKVFKIFLDKTDDENNSSRDMMDATAYATAYATGALDSLKKENIFKSFLKGEDLECSDDYEERMKNILIKKQIKIAFDTAAKPLSFIESIKDTLHPTTMSEINLHVHAIQNILIAEYARHTSLKDEMGLR